MKLLPMSRSAVTLLLVLSACDNNPTRGKEVAQAALPAAESGAMAPGSLLLTVNEKSGTIGFVGAKVTAKHEGGFAAFKGQITLADTIEASQVALDIDVASLAVEPAKLRGHLLGPDFFDVAKFPLSSFKSTSIQAASGGYSVTGNLELHGVKKSITFPAQIVKTQGGVNVQAEFGISRKDFGIQYPGMADDLIKDEVLVRLDLKPRA